MSVLRTTLLSLGFLVVCACAAQAGINTRFGFTGPEIFPIDHQVGSLIAEDFDADTKLDLVVVNNRRSRLELLYNRTGKNTPLPTRSRDGGVNQLPPDARFERVALPTEMRVAGMAVGDFDGDGRPDIVIHGQPNRFQWLRNAGERKWDEPVSWRLDDAAGTGNGIQTGDVNGDGRLDVLLLGTDGVIVFRQAEKGGFAEPEKMPFVGTVQALDVRDLNGDDRDDLLMLNWDHRNPLRVRWQDENGRLGPESHYRLPRIRSLSVGNLDADPKPELVSILALSGRVQVGEFSTPKPATDLASATLWLKPFSRGSGAERGAVWADVDADGRVDLVHAEPETGALSVQLQGDGGVFAESLSYPSLSGIEQIQALDWDKNGRANLFLFSAEERQVGVVEMGKDKDLAFPRLLPLDGKPLAIATGRFSGKEPPLAAVLLDQDGRRVVELHRAKGKASRIALSKDVRSSPSRMFFHDADQDGTNELVLLTPYEKVLILRRGKQAGSLEEIVLNPPGGTVSKPVYGIADLDWDGKGELLLPQKSFVRSVVLDRPAGGGWNFRVTAQINGGDRNSQISAITAARLGQGPKAEKAVLLLDAGTGKLAICKRQKRGDWAIDRELELPEAGFVSMEPIRIGAADRGVSIGFLGLNTAAWISAGVAAPRLQNSVWFESDIENARLLDTVIGDLNADGRRDLVFLEGRGNRIEIGVYWAEKVKSAVHWRVFEQKTFRGMGAGTPEPREAVVGDFTGDDRADLAVLVHDRVLLYPQE